MTRTSAAWVAVAWLVGACAGGGGGFDPGRAPIPAVTLDARPVADGEIVDAELRGEALGVLRVGNGGEGPLVLRRIEVTGPGAGGLMLDAGGLPATVAPGAAAWALPLGWVGDPAPAIVTLHTNRSVHGRDRFQLTVRPVPGTARGVPSPARLDLGSVATGTTATADVQLLSTGVVPLHVTAVTLRGPAGFSVELPGGAALGADPAAPAIELPAALVVQPGALARLVVRYAASDPAPAAAELVLATNDPTAPDGLLVPLAANGSGPCLVASPLAIDFGAKPVGVTASAEVSLASCGTAPLHVTALHLEPAAAEAFALDDAPAPPFDLAPGEHLDVRVRWTPLQASAPGPDGAPAPDTAALVVEADGPAPRLEIPLRGTGYAPGCPVAVIDVLEGEEVVPQTLLHLDGSGSLGASGPVTDFAWTVVQPAGAVGVLQPSASVAAPTFRADVAGLYRFTLAVQDAAGTPGCEAAEALVLVEPDNALHVELLWHTPADPDESDEGPEAGADLDLHLLHPFATGEDIDGDGQPDGWFDLPFDCFWFNGHPAWGSFDATVPDDPRLDRDDTDGAGPENVNLDLPEDGATYRIGVHAWRDHGFGPSVATVRVYVFGSLAYEAAGVTLVERDLWEVAEIAWPSGQVTPAVAAGGGPIILPDAGTPLFP